jgi:signal peptidase II
MSPANEQHAGEAPRGAAVARAASGWRWLPVSALVIGLDQLVKAWIVAHIPLYGTVRILPVLNLTLTYNRGAAFSFLAGASGWQKWLFAGLALAVSLGIALWLRRLNARRNALLCLGLTLILGGALGNLIDRLRIGHVIDFVSAHWHDAYFPAFNVADSAITVGAALLLIDALRESRGPKKEGA